MKKEKELRWKEFIGNYIKSLREQKQLSRQSLKEATKINVGYIEEGKGTSVYKFLMLISHLQELEIDIDEVISRIGKNVSFLRRLKGKTGRETEKGSGISRNTQIKIESGNNQSTGIITLIKILSYLELPLQLIFVKDLEQTIINKVTETYYDVDDPVTKAFDEMLSVNKCYSCHQKRDSNWDFCPHCGVKLFKLE